MALQPNSSFGNYHIGNVIGEGGMGQVFLATDTTLDRKVAIKVLPESFAQDADRVARFEREAKTLASLNHNNIAQIYGIEKSAVTAIVMELVEGPTLADLIAKGPLPPEEALRIARQIIDGLEAAHDRGIVHRDLKPANIKVKADGLVKILDFGIAKPIEVAGSSGGHSPTLVTPAMTEAGVIMGTAAYMSPEQARGKFVDQRTDIWAFGCLLYEMLTGQPAFIGEDVMIVMASILRDKSDLDSIPAAISPAVRNTIKVCLEKDPKKRLHHIGDVRLALSGVLESGVQTTAAAAQRSSPVQFWLRALPLALVVAALVGLAAWQFKPEAPRPVVRFVHDLPESRTLTLTVAGLLDIAPDGRRLVYNSSDGLVVRDLDAIEDRVIPGSPTRFFTKFSPDGESLVFVGLVASTGGIGRIDVNGGPELLLGSVPLGMTGGDISWSADGTLLLGVDGQGIYRVPENGGDFELIVQLEPNQRVGAPQLLPGGNWMLFNLGDGVQGNLVAQSIITGERRTLRSGAAYGRYVPTGHLVYQAQNTLFAVGFDPEALEFAGTPVPVVQGVRSSGMINSAQYAIADDGTLIYVPGVGADTEGLTLALVDGQGNQEVLTVPPGSYANPRASGDGRWIAFEAQYADGRDIAVYEIGSAAAPRRLTFGGDNTHPVWSADGLRVAYASARTDGPGIFWRLGDGTGAEERLTQAAPGETHTPEHFAPDGQTLAYTVERDAASAIWQLALATRAASVLVEAPGPGASHAMFSPDGRWLTYQAYDTGDNEIFVQPFPPTGAKYQVPSSGDNHHPAWSPDGRQLYYIPGPGLFERVDVSTERGVGFGNPVALQLDPLRGGGPNIARPYDLMPDGSVLGTMSAGAETIGERDRIIVVQNWFVELERLVPTE